MKTKKKTVAKVAPKISTVQVGAARALERLASEEASLFTTYENAKKAGDPLETKLAHAAWLRTSEGLRKFDILIEAARREVGELLPRTDVERWLNNAGDNLYFALLRAVEYSNRGDRQKVHDVLADTFLTSIKDYNPKLSAPVQEVPIWFHTQLFNRMHPPPAEMRNKCRKIWSLVDGMDKFKDSPTFQQDIEKHLKIEFAKIDSETTAPKKETPA